MITLALLDSTASAAEVSTAVLAGDIATHIGAGVEVETTSNTSRCAPTSTSTCPTD